MSSHASSRSTSRAPSSFDDDERCVHAHPLAGWDRREHLRIAIDAADVEQRCVGADERDHRRATRTDERGPLLEMQPDGRRGIVVLVHRRSPRSLPVPPAGLRLRFAAAWAASPEGRG